MRTPITTTNEWTFELLEKYYAEIERIAKDLGLEWYPNQIEIISAEQMLDLYSTVGLPIAYNHWSYGKDFISNARSYKRGEMGLAYEIVSNTSPCLVYCMEENTMMMQILVMAHAGIGHNAFFKNNYMFKQWTSADSIVDYLIFAKNYIAECEEKYGIDEVEETLDACHALQTYGVDKYKRPSKISMVKEEQRQKERNEYLQGQLNDMWRTVPETVDRGDEKIIKERFPKEPQENILYFIEKNAPNLPTWKREIIRIVRKISQYFYPQKQTKVANEGFATFIHYTIMNQLREENLISDGFMLEFLASHTAVIRQLPFDHKFYSGFNPYALGFAIFSDIRRMCEHPTEEDKIWFPDLVGTDWKKAVKFAMENFKDESFILQYLSPKVMRDLKLFSIEDFEGIDHYYVKAIHDDVGYAKIRRGLSKQYDLTSSEPNIQVYNVDRWGDRMLTLRHTIVNGRPLDVDSCKEVLKHAAKLWGFRVRLESIDVNDKVKNMVEMPQRKIDLLKLDFIVY
jgi:spore cortex formation protein SpoVR/YcgB (stage V sporulation)